MAETLILRRFSPLLSGYGAYYSNRDCRIPDRWAVTEQKRNSEALAEAMKGLVERVAMKIVALPKQQRTAQYAIVRRTLRDTAEKLGFGGKDAESFAEL